MQPGVAVGIVKIGTLVTGGAAVVVVASHGGGVNVGNVLPPVHVGLRLFDCQYIHLLLEGKRK